MTRDSHLLQFKQWDGFWAEDKVPEHRPIKTQKKLRLQSGGKIEKVRKSFFGSLLDVVQGKSKAPKVEPNQSPTQEPVADSSAETAHERSADIIEDVSVKVKLLTSKVIKDAGDGEGGDDMFKPNEEGEKPKNSAKPASTDIVKPTAPGPPAAKDKLVNLPTIDVDYFGKS